MVDQERAYGGLLPGVAKVVNHAGITGFGGVRCLRCGRTDHITISAHAESDQTMGFVCDTCHNELTEQAENSFPDYGPCDSCGNIVGYDAGGVIGPEMKTVLCKDCAGGKPPTVPMPTTHEEIMVDLIRRLRDECMQNTTTAVSEAVDESDRLLANYQGHQNWASGNLTGEIVS